MANEVKTEETRLQKKSDLFAPKKYGIAAQREQAMAELKSINPLECTNRLGIIFDDSISMAGQKIKDARMGITNFLSSCKPQETSIALYPLESSSKTLTIDYNTLNVYVSCLTTIGGTPLYEAIKRCQNNEKLTRNVVFSDGEPNPDDIYHKDDVIQYARENKVPIDTVFIGDKLSRGYKELEQLAELTGGIFVHFEDSAQLNRNLKYLSPGLRGLLADPSIKNKVEKGQM